jgi:outer membrane protein TolC
MKKDISFSILFLKLFITISLLTLPYLSNAQGVSAISLDTCLKLATENYPLAKQKGYLQTIGENNLKSINSAWLPQLNMDLKATEFSEVVNLSLPGFPRMVFPLDQENFSLNLNQTIFDGGLSGQQKKTDVANTETEIQKNEVELYKVKEKVIQLYGNILLSKENLNVLKSYTEDINSRKEKMTSSVNNGIMLQSNLDVLEAEILKTKQKIIEANSNLQVLCKVISLLINRQVDESTSFTDISIAMVSKTDSIKRPELKLFDFQQNLIEQKMKLSNRKTLPHLYLFGDGAYGRPGFNFLNQDFRFYGFAGVNLKWNISSIYNISYEKKNLMINKKMIDEQKELFQLNLNTTMVQQDGEIEKLKQVIDIDKAIVVKRESISKSTSNQLDNGLITSSDYLTELTAEKQALLNQLMHEIQLGIAIRNYKVSTGN